MQTNTTRQRIKVLLVEDNPGDVALIRLQLERQRPLSSLHPYFEIVHRDTLHGAITYAKEHHVDVVLLDLGLDVSEGLETFVLFYEEAPDLPVIVLTGQEDEQLGLTTINSGAQDYLVKGQGDASTLVRSLRYAIQRKQSENELSKYKEHLEELVRERTEQLEATYEKLGQSERLASLGALAAGIAHEINNPIATIILATQNALAAPPTTEEQLQSFCSKVLNHANRCALIVKGVLQFSRKQRAERWPNSLNELTERTLRLFADSDPQHAQAVKVELDSRTPVLCLNPLEIEQVLLNLLRNSFDAGKANTVKVRTNLRSGAAVLSVEDNGCGISEEQQRHIFDPFFTTRQNQGGTGLGLSIVHGIVTAHGGSVEVESTEGVGTTISVVLPIEEESKRPAAVI